MGDCTPMRRKCDDISTVGEETIILRQFTNAEGNIFGGSGISSESDITVGGGELRGLPQGGARQVAPPRQSLR